MTIKQLSEYIKNIEDTSSRLDMTQHLADLFIKLDASEIDKVIYLIQGRLAPQFVKLDFNLGEKLVKKAVAQALNLDSSVFTKKYKEIGDLGQATQEFKQEIQSIMERDMSVDEVFERLTALAHAEGTGSQDTKLSILGELIQTVDPLSSRYIVRIPTNALRLGFSDMTILDAFSWMLKGDKSLRKDIEGVYHVMPDLGKIAKKLKKDGMNGISTIEPELFTPILMMKAQRLPSPKEIVEKVGEGLIEPKYDGFRLQVHYKGDEVRLYSRGLDDVTYMYPDIVEGVKKEMKCKNMIFEGEAIGFDPYTESFLPFQQTVQRKRKYNIEEKAEEIPLRMFAFDLLYVDGTSYINNPLKKRMDKLRECLHLSGDIHQDTLLITEEESLESVEKLEKEFDEAVAKGLEGIMVKKLDGVYQPGARGHNWIKYKRSESSKIEDTMDCVVMGYDAGKGKRTDFGIGAFLVGIFDEKEDLYKTVAKIGTGLTDDEFREMKRRCDKVASDKKPALYDVAKETNVDVWTMPEIVVEVKADEISRSPTHTAGKTDDTNEPGYALRFPRLVRFRDDKRPEDATELREVEQMFRDQM